MRYSIGTQSASAQVSATGGNMVTNYTLNGTNFTAHIFTNAGTLSVTAGGGGSGATTNNSNGTGDGGAGGAGIVIIRYVVSPAATVITIL